MRIRSVKYVQIISSLLPRFPWIDLLHFYVHHAKAFSDQFYQKIRRMAIIKVVLEIIFFSANFEYFNSCHWIQTKLKAIVGTLSKICFRNTGVKKKSAPLCLMCKSGRKLFEKTNPNIGEYISMPNQSNLFCFLLKILIQKRTFKFSTRWAHKLSQTLNLFLNQILQFEWGVLTKFFKNLDGTAGCHISWTKVDECCKFINIVNGLAKTSRHIYKLWFFTFYWFVWNGIHC